MTPVDGVVCSAAAENPHPNQSSGIVSPASRAISIMLYSIRTPASNRAVAQIRLRGERRTENLGRRCFSEFIIFPCAC